MQPRQFSINLPPWLSDFASDEHGDFRDPAARMAWVIELARRNVLKNTGGPFAAAVFETDSHRLVALGVNSVESSGWSCAHAEVLALSMAEQALGCFDLSAAHLPGYELVSSCEPCVMCLGATLWSGVQRLLCGARDEDARAIGFDEGPKPHDWAAAMQQRGVEVVQDLLREEACAVLALYQKRGGTIYNPSR